MGTKKLFHIDMTKEQLESYLCEFEKSENNCLSLFGTIEYIAASNKLHIPCDHLFCDALSQDGFDCEKCRISKRRRYERKHIIEYCFGDKSIRGNIIVGAHSEKSE